MTIEARHRLRVRTLVTAVGGAAALVVSGGILVSHLQHRGVPAATGSNAAATNQAPGRSPGPSAGLPPCITPTATNCDRSRLPPAGTQGAPGCKGTGPATISASPIAFNDIAYIQPMGLMVGGHVTPIDHGYFYVKGALADPPQPTAVYSPIDGTVSFVSRTIRDGSYSDYAVTIEATCTFRVRFSNMVGFAGRLGDTVGQLAGDQSEMPGFPVKAGELIGYTGSTIIRGIDVWVENDASTLTGFIDPAQYTAAEVWKTHVVDLFQYTQEPLRDQLLALDERDAAPRWGKIDYDQDGRLVGNWFEVGSGGYGGNKGGAAGYWVGHLSVVYNGDDPSQIEVSFGDYEGQPQQFAVIGNSPDPATVSQSTGLVKYQLGSIEYYSADTGQVWDTQHYLAHMRARAGGTAVGTVLMEMVGPRSLKVEIFPRETAGQVSGFDSAALMYER